MRVVLTSVYWWTWGVICLNITTFSWPDCSPVNRVPLYVCCVMAPLYSLLSHSIPHIQHSIYRLNPDKIFEELQACPKEVITLCFTLTAKISSLVWYDITSLLRLSNQDRLLIDWLKTAHFCISPSEIKQMNSIMSCKSTSFLMTQMVSAVFAQWMLGKLRAFSIVGGL